jgi:hypothetical protein
METRRRIIAAIKCGWLLLSVLLPLALFTFHFPPKRSAVSASLWLRRRPPAYFSSVSRLGVEFAAFLLVLLLGLGGDICFLFVSVYVSLELR